MKTNDELDNVNTLFDEYMLSKDKKDYNKAVETMKVAVAQGRELDSNPLCKTPENNPLLIQIMNKVKHLIIRARSLQLETLNEPSDIANKGQQTVNNKQIVTNQLITPSNSFRQLPQVDLQQFSSSTLPISSAVPIQAPIPKHPDESRLINAITIPENLVRHQSKSEFDISASTSLPVTSPLKQGFLEQLSNEIMTPNKPKQPTPDPAQTDQNSMQTNPTPKRQPSQNPIQPKPNSPSIRQLDESKPQHTPTQPEKHIQHFQPLQLEPTQAKLEAVSDTELSVKRRGRNESTMQHNQTPEKPKGVEQRSFSTSNLEHDDKGKLILRIQELEAKLAVKDANNEAYYTLLKDLQTSEAKVGSLMQKSQEDEQRAKVAEGSC